MKLEDFIKDNRHEFDLETPLQGHEDRFAQLLGEQEEKKRPRKRLWIPLALTACLAGLLVGFALIHLQQKNAVNSCSLSGEIAEVNSFYQSQLNSKLTNLTLLLSTADQDTKSDIMLSVEQMKSESDKLISDLCGKNGDTAITVLVNHYQTNIEVIQQITSLVENDSRIING